MSMMADIREDLAHTALSVRFEILKHMRRTRLLIALSLAIVIPILFYVIPKVAGVSFSSTADGYMSNILSFGSFLIIISAALFAGDAVSGEFESKTALLTLSTPQRRTSIFIGKYLAATLAVFTIVTLYYLVGVFEVVGIYGVSKVPIVTMRSYLLALLYSTAVLSLTYWFSSVVKGTMASTLLSFFGLIMVLPIVSGLLTVAKVEPWFIVTYSAGLITDVFLQPGFGGGGGGGGGPPEAFTSYSPQFTTGVEVMAAYAIIFFIIAIILSTRRDVE